MFNSIARNIDLEHEWQQRKRGGGGSHEDEDKTFGAVNCPPDPCALLADRFAPGSLKEQLTNTAESGCALQLARQDCAAKARMNGNGKYFIQCSFD